jgi:putative hydrolase of HD superfamily
MPSDIGILIPLGSVLRFFDFMQQYQSIVRRVSVPNRDHFENNVEHSYQLGMMAWYLNSAYGFGLDSTRLIAYALIHDLVEIYAGDIPWNEQHDLELKRRRELAALEQIAREWSAEFPELISFMHDYENGCDDEAAFIRDLDKIMANITIYRSGGIVWQQFDQSFEWLTATTRSKVFRTPELVRLMDQLHEQLAGMPELFAPPQHQQLALALG